ncbi:MAG: hypothetical protein IPH31_14535 [Lewinellaceae bacterium]|nr:hypothetical protein [Lewinellaceae bacterium]
MKAEDLFSYLVQHWKELQTSVLEGKYRPEAVRRVEIPKPNGGVRQLGIPTVIDRMPTNVARLWTRNMMGCSRD